MIRELEVKKITQVVRQLCIEANEQLGEDVLACFQQARQNEPSPVGQEILEQLIENARIAKEESVNDVSQDLRDLDGLTAPLIAKLAEGGIHTRDDLADLAVDELIEITALDDATAKALIMKAREHWFND